MSNPKAKLREQLHEVMRFHHYSERTEETHWNWIRQFIVFHGKWHPRELGEAEVHAFLTHLAAENNVAAATQNQALNAQVLHRPLGQIEEFERPTRPARLPVVLALAEVKRLLAAMPARYGWLARLLYGSGLRVIDGRTAFAGSPREINRTWQRIVMCTFCARPKMVSFMLA
ncbi:MAG: phage integrase N-terminal SAM-like domain-containing protein [Verrucomicrobia bacterium]|nr:phage integrase N-terminal SAM-like domain-containing protein [Verrucomicrobiota bacterium]